MPAPPEPPAPQPTGTLSVSPEITFTLPGVVPKALAVTCWITASEPWPCSVIDVWTITAPDASIRAAAPSWDDMRAPPSP